MGEVKVAGTEAVVKKARTPRPGECRGRMRRAVAKEFDEIVRGFIEAAKKGSCPHVKLATELVSQPGRRRTKRESSLEELLRKMDSEQVEMEQRQRESEFGVQRPWLRQGEE